MSDFIIVAIQISMWNVIIISLYFLTVSSQCFYKLYLYREAEEWSDDPCEKCRCFNKSVECWDIPVIQPVGTEGRCFNCTVGEYFDCIGTSMTSKRQAVTSKSALFFRRTNRPLPPLPLSSRTSPAQREVTAAVENSGAYTTKEVGRVV